MSLFFKKMKRKKDFDLKKKPCQPEKSEIGCLHYVLRSNQFMCSIQKIIQISPMF